jgi:hypothetical protein
VLLEVFELVLLDVLDEVFELVLDEVFELVLDEVFELVLDEVFELVLLEEFPATLKLPSCLATGAFSKSRPACEAACAPTAPAAKIAAEASVVIVILFIKILHRCDRNACGHQHNGRRWCIFPATICERYDERRCGQWRRFAVTQSVVSPLELDS